MSGRRSLFSSSRRVSPISPILIGRESRFDKCPKNINTLAELCAVGIPRVLLAGESTTTGTSKQQQQDPLFPLLLRRTLPYPHILSEDHLFFSELLSPDTPILALRKRGTTLS